MAKVQVISERGKLVGTFIPQSAPADPKAPVGMPVSRRGQKLHEVEIENAETFYKEKRSAELHKIVKKKLKLK
jgi:hypothetical protein